MGSAVNPNRELCEGSRDAQEPMLFLGLKKNIQTNKTLHVQVMFSTLRDMDQVVNTHVKGYRREQASPEKCAEIRKGAEDEHHQLTDRSINVHAFQKNVIAMSLLIKIYSQCAI